MDSTQDKDRLRKASEIRAKLKEMGIKDRSETAILFALNEHAYDEADTIDALINQPYDDFVGPARKQQNILRKEAPARQQKKKQGGSAQQDRRGRHREDRTTRKNEGPTKERRQVPSQGSGHHANQHQNQQGGEAQITAATSKHVKSWAANKNQRQKQAPNGLSTSAKPSPEVTQHASDNSRQFFNNQSFQGSLHKPQTPQPETAFQPRKSASPKIRSYAAIAGKRPVELVRPRQPVAVHVEPTHPDPVLDQQPVQSTILEQLETNTYISTETDGESPPFTFRVEDTQEAVIIHTQETPDDSAILAEVAAPLENETAQLSTDASWMQSVSTSNVNITGSDQGAQPQVVESHEEKTTWAMRISKRQPKLAPGSAVLVPGLNSNAGPDLPISFGFDDFPMNAKVNVESVENNNIEAPVKHQPVSTHHEQPQLPPEDEAVSEAVSSLRLEEPSQQILSQQGHDHHKHKEQQVRQHQQAHQQQQQHHQQTQQQHHQQQQPSRQQHHDSDTPTSSLQPLPDMMETMKSANTPYTSGIDGRMSVRSQGTQPSPQQHPHADAQPMIPPTMIPSSVMDPQGMMGIAPEIYNHMSQPHQAAMPTTQALFGQPPTYRPMMGGRHIPNIGDFGGSESFPRRTHQRGGGGGGAHGQQQPQQQDHQSQLSRDSSHMHKGNKQVYQQSQPYPQRTYRHNAQQQQMGYMPMWYPHHPAYFPPFYRQSAPMFQQPTTTPHQEDVTEFDEMAGQPTSRPQAPTGIFPPDYSQMQQFIPQQQFMPPYY